MATDRGPHRVLLQEDTLDLILCFIDKKSWKVARLVCWSWNQRLIANFRKSWKLALVKCSGNISKVLSSLDKRMLANISVVSPNLSLDVGIRILERTCDHFRSAEAFMLLCRLQLQISEKALDLFIQVVNEGVFQGLLELLLKVRFNKGGNDYKCREIVTIPNALSGLKNLKAKIEINDPGNDEEELRVSNENILTAVQSFVPAAPNVKELATNVFLDLTGRDVRKLRLNLRLLKRVDAVRMLTAVRRSMTYLFVSYMQSVFEDSQIFPNLTTLIQFENEATVEYIEEELNLEAVPELRVVEIPYIVIPWEEFMENMPPAGKLREVKVTHILHDHEDDHPFLIEHLTYLLNAKLDRLTLEFSEDMMISQLLGFLEFVFLEKKGEGSEVLVLNFLTGGWMGAAETDRECLSELSSLLEKLGERWRIVRLSNFEFPLVPAWTLVLLYDEQKTGRFKVIGPGDVLGMDVSLEIVG